MPNRLAAQKSPYLLQHADNPVDWFPWGAEALERAKDEGKPILVSIGYSACHWCHVMAHESFENAATAGYMNDNFVNIKVDREERPDVDAIYMEAVQAMSGQGGWPLNVFLTSDGRPFFGGTYFPPEPRHGMPSWRAVLEQVSFAYGNRKEDVSHNAETLTQYIRSSQRLAPASSLGPEILVGASRNARAQFDGQHGGFGGAPKFPQPLALDLMLRMWLRFGDQNALDFVRLTLGRMAGGGLFDQLGGGFHRYSVDDTWLVPHFEKMLYDNALLARVYLHAYQATHDPQDREIAERTLDYLLRDLLSPDGGFYSAEDADSEGEEGKFYVWTQKELTLALGEDAELAALYYGVTPGGNFEGSSILTALAPISEAAGKLCVTVPEAEILLARVRQTLFDVRSRRERPAKDTKVLTSWNALAIRALAEASRVLSRPDYMSAAERAAKFALASLRPDGRLVRSWNDGAGAVPGFLEDYAYMIEALITLYETAFDLDYLIVAKDMAAQMVEQFWNGDEGIFYDTSVEAEPLVVRPRSLFDNPIASGNSAAAFGLLRLHALTGNSEYEKLALQAIRSAGDLLYRAPLAVSYLLSALDFHLTGPLQVAVVRPEGESFDGLMEVVFDRFLPNLVVAAGAAEDVHLLEGRESLDGKTTAYVCEHFACRLPVTEPEGLAAQLDERTRSHTFA
jgi:uncharacterized protein YyaL (SSP411 family)